MRQWRLPLGTGTGGGKLSAGSMAVGAGRKTGNMTLTRGGNGAPPWTWAGGGGGFCEWVGAEGGWGDVPGGGGVLPRRVLLFFLLFSAVGPPLKHFFYPFISWCQWPNRSPNTSFFGK
ncbi:hypothetical protein NGUA28_04282 [Salmonella enterica]|nr:hypothetical protein NGUA28_04282 [Salmonella enterica]